jgi:hypothetical protein
MSCYLVKVYRHMYTFCLRRTQLSVTHFLNCILHFLLPLLKVLSPTMRIFVCIGLLVTVGAFCLDEATAHQPGETARNEAPISEIGTEAFQDDGPSQSEEITTADDFFIGLPGSWASPPYPRTSSPSPALPSFFTRKRRIPVGLGVRLPALGSSFRRRVGGDGSAPWTKSRANNSPRRQGGGGGVSAFHGGSAGMSWGALGSCPSCCLWPASWESSCRTYFNCFSCQ